MEKSIVFSVSPKILASKIIKLLNYQFEKNDDLLYKGITEGFVSIEEFADGEISVAFLNAVRNRRVYLVCSTENLKDEKILTLLIDAAKNSHASKIIAVIPYYAYARQDKKSKHRGCIGARVLANNLVANGLDAAFMVELHSVAIQGMFSIPVDNIPLEKIFFKEVNSYLYKTIDPGSMYSICSPDQGGTERASRFYREILSQNGGDASFVNGLINTPVVIKHRDKPNSVESMAVYGNVEFRKVVIVDDIIDTAGTICKAAHIIHDNGAKEIIIVCPNVIFSGAALNLIDESPINHIFVSDTAEIGIKRLEEFKFTNTKYTIVSAASCLAEHIYKDFKGLTTI